MDHGRKLFYRAILLWLVLLSGISSTHALPLTLYSSYQEVRQTLYHDGVLYAATSGGLVIYAPGSDSFRILSTADGLAENNLQQVGITTDGILWTVGHSMDMDLFTLPDLFHITCFQEFQEEPVLNEINAFLTDGDWVLVGSDIGLTRLRWDNELATVRVEYTLRRFGNSDDAAVTAIAYRGEHLLVSTRSTVWEQQPDLGSPANPNTWTSRLSLSAYEHVHSTLGYDNQVDLLIADQSDTTWSIKRVEDTVVDLPLLPEMIHADLKDLTRHDGQLLVASNQWVYEFDDTAFSPLTEVNQLQHFATGDDTDWYISSPTHTQRTHFRRLISDQSQELPLTPARYIYDMDWSDEGDLWVVGQGDNYHGAGLYQLTDGVWYAWTQQNPELESVPYMGTESFGAVLVDQAGWVWFSTWGKGLYLFKPAEQSFTRFNQTSPETQRLYGYRLDDGSTGSDYVLVTGMDMDSAGNIWLINNRSETGRTLVCIPAEIHDDPDYPFQYYETSERNLHLVNCDQDGRIWLGAGLKDGSLQNKDLFLLEPTDPSLPLAKQPELQETHIRLSDAEYNGGDIEIGMITDLDVDRNGTLWVGTTNGLYYSSVYLQDVTAFNRILYIEGLGDEEIHSLAVDPRNRLWISTEPRIDVLDSYYFTFSEHHAVADNGAALQNTGLLKFSPVSGQLALTMGESVGLLNTWHTEHPARQQSDVAAYPNPFNPRESSLSFPAAEISRYSRAAVYNIQGQLLRELDGVMLDRKWDGYDEDGNLVPPGVYTILFYGDGGSGRARVAVIH